jgi:multicomponent Na+:H+ antiporter subunit G
MEAAIGMIVDFLIMACMIVGTFLMLISGIGLVRLPDVYCRMHAAGKAGTLGVALLILAPALHFAVTEPFVTVRALAAIVFQMLTTPGATHLLAHACYVRGYPVHSGTSLDELESVFPSYPADRFGQE